MKTMSQHARLVGDTLGSARYRWIAEGDPEATEEPEGGEETLGGDDGQVG